MAMGKVWNMQQDRRRVESTKRIWAEDLEGCRISCDAVFWIVWDYQAVYESGEA